MGDEGESSLTDKGDAVTFINVNRGPDINFFMDSHLTELELAHQFLGDTSKNRTASANQESDGGIAIRNFFQDWTHWSQDAYRVGLESAPYASPTNPTQ